MFYKSGSPVFGRLSHDHTTAWGYDGDSAWGMVVWKVIAKVKGNYLSNRGLGGREEMTLFFTGSP